MTSKENGADLLHRLNHDLNNRRLHLIYCKERYSKYMYDLP